VVEFSLNVFSFLGQLACNDTITEITYISYLGHAGRATTLSIAELKKGVQNSVRDSAALTGDKYAPIRLAVQLCCQAIQVGMVTGFATGQKMSGTSCTMSPKRWTTAWTMSPRAYQ
jgi:hypothetical protein